MTKKKLLLIDGNSIAYKGFYALYNSIENFTSETGLHTNAIYAFNLMLDKILGDVNPDDTLVAFDASNHTFRNNLYDHYKEGRKRMPDEFREQIPYIKELLHKRGIRTYELANYEADDIIGTLAKRADRSKYKTVILTGDRDLTQLASSNTSVMVSKRGISDTRTYTPELVKKEFGVTPEQIVDIKGLQGDTSDNYPGVEKVGPKTAQNLIQKYDNMENLYSNLEEMKPSKLKEHLTKDKNQAFLSKKLARIDRDAPVTIKPFDSNKQVYNSNKLADFYKKLNFNSFLKKLNSDTDNKNLNSKILDLPYTELTSVNLEELNNLTGEITFSLDILIDNYNDFIGENDKGGFVIGNAKHWFVSKDLHLLQSPILKKILASNQIKKNVFDLKRQAVLLNKIGVKLDNIDFDLLLVSYLLNTHDNSNDLGKVAVKHNFNQVESDEAVYGKGKKKKIPTDKLFFQHLVRKANAIQALRPSLTKELKEKKLDKLYEDIELPLSKVLTNMEEEGIKVDVVKLQQMQIKYQQQLLEIKNKIQQEAGEEFNLDSPKQMGYILFDKLKLPVLKQNKTGPSTSAAVLEELAPTYEIVRDILEYRKIGKILSTYIEGLLKAVDSLDNKIHTRYLQTLAQTGRLSSVDPNLQNIPIRTEEGKRVREVFIPNHKDWEMFSADYSQIELRLLAQISDDKNLKKAFKNDADIHDSTAHRIFGLSADSKVDANLRRQAKAVNFGIVYGISPFGLAKSANISTDQAQNFINKYFNEYPGVKRYMDNMIKTGRKQGYVETLFNRRRYLSYMHAKNFSQRSAEERIAINAPIQGSAADIIKIAMIKVNHMLKEHNLKAKMLLQIHDELVFTAPKDEIPILQKLVPKVMDSVGNLDVPLKVETHHGKNLYVVK